MMEVVYDISNHQGEVDFNAIKETGAYGVILKAGGSDGGFYKDWYFEQNYARAFNAGLHIGAYYYVGKDCKSYDDGKADAERFLKQIAGKTFDLPVYMDFEAPDTSNKQGNTDSVIAFCKVLEKAGYYVGIYGSDESTFVDRLYKDQLRDYAWWVADYSNQPTHAVPFGMWQFTSKARVNGVQGDVDKNYLYIDYVGAIVSGGFNGYSNVSSSEGNDTTVSTGTALAIGDTIMIKTGAKDLNSGGYYASFVYNNEYKVIEITGNRVVFGNERGITGATDISNIIKL